MNRAQNTTDRVRGIAPKEGVDHVHTFRSGVPRTATEAGLARAQAKALTGPEASRCACSPGPSRPTSTTKWKPRARLRGSQQLGAGCRLQARARALLSNIPVPLNRESKPSQRPFSFSVTQNVSSRIPRRCRWLVAAHGVVRSAALAGGFRATGAGRAWCPSCTRWTRRDVRNSGWCPEVARVTSPSTTSC